MITEDYVSFEVAKLLKEKGFNEECDVAYSKINGEYLLNDAVDDYGYGSTNSYLECKNEISAPTLQIAMKWLREQHELIITIDFDKYEGYDNNTVVGFGFTIQKKSNPAKYDYIHNEVFDTYEEAEESAIKYCLTTLTD